MRLVRNLGEKYSPFYFLSSLGAGGLSVSFFMYFMFMVEHKDAPLPTFKHLFGNMGEKFDFSSVLIIVGSITIVFFAYLHIRLLIWNIKEYMQFKKTKAYEELKSSNAEVVLMAIPLTYGMTINVCFVLGAAFIPNLWDIVEYLFPFAFLAFLAVGIYALKIFSEYFVRLITQASFDFASNNNLSQMISIFAFAMLAVGFAAPGAMSKTIEVSAISLFFAVFFTSIAVSLILVKITLGLDAIFKEGISKEASVSLWIMIPILTILGITFIRMIFGFHHSFIHAHPSPAWFFVLGSVVISLQIMFGLVGYLVMKRVGYFKDFIYGDKKSPSSYAIICPGVAFFVFGMFFVGLSLVKSGVLPKFGVLYFITIAPFIYVQFKTIFVFFRLNKKLLAKK